MREEQEKERFKQLKEEEERLTKQREDEARAKRLQREEEERNKKQREEQEKKKKEEEAAAKSRPLLNSSSGNNNNNNSSSSGGGVRFAEPAPSSSANDIISGSAVKPKGVGDMWAKQIADKKESEHAAERKKIRGRRAGGVQFIDGQIRKVIEEIKRLNIGGGGLGACTFGVLFDATQEHMSALAATLNVAKKRGVIHYDGEMLMQGVDTNVVITLLKDEIEDTPVFQSVYVASTSSANRPEPAAQSGPEKCVNCGKIVYPNERLNANGKTMHKACFRCTMCNTVLKLAQYAHNNGKFYCVPHFNEQFSKNGYSF